MKKGLSVLLIAAALFGFYGGATSLTDVLASKAYWEEQGEKSTADMNKLEDGLNQLKDNEKAYLDGQKQLADGEKQLADAEKQLADGEAKLADGKAELAKGYADYAAAPAKLADARRQLAEGKEDLEEGEEQLNGLSKLISYLNDVNNKYSKWKTLYQQAVTDRAALSKGVAPAKDELLAVADLLPAEKQEAFKGAVNAMAANKTPEKAETAADYVTILNYAAAVNDGVATVQTTVKTGLDGATALKDAATSYSGTISVDGGVTFRGFVKSKQTELSSMAQYAYKAGGATVYTNYNTAISKLSGSGELDAGTVGEYATYLITGLTYAEGALQDVYNSVTTDGIKSAQATMKKFTDAYASGESDGIVSSDIFQNQLAGADGGQGYIATVMQGVAANVLGNTTLKTAVKENMGSDALTLLNVLANTETMFPYVAGTYDGGSSFQTFAYMMDTYPGILSKLIGARNLLAQARLSGLNTYNEGLAKYNAGLKEYNKGLADYAAAPGKLADGEKQVADGEKQLADGYKQYEDGKKALADGKKKLAEYEDGEQQVRDGLATLMATKADPGLESILDRRNGDDKFDDANGHLQLNEGLEAVDTGRGYQADSGELITKEVTNRAVGTAAGLGAAVLAVLAAILSFVRKYKGAAISAVLAAIVGCIGAFIGFGAGEYYSDIAGSTIGNTPFIAAAVLAAVAAVFSGVHFTAKPEAKEVKETKSAK